MSEDQTLSMVHYVLILVLISSGLLVHFRGKMSKAFKYAGIWLVIIMSLTVLYTFKHDFQDFKDRVVGAFLPSKAINNEDGSISFRVSKDGHYYINTVTNGKNVKFMVDTGASDIVIDRKLARRIGIDINSLRFIMTYNTANGTVRGAPIRLESLKIGDYAFYDIRASVNEADMDEPLLGMRFLDKLDGYEVKRDTLTIWP